MSDGVKNFFLVISTQKLMDFGQFFDQGFVQNTKVNLNAL